ncbi:Uncharacterized conserved protein [Phaffia rhodozyma]|uniref:tRNA-dihydrouridine(47) synthase [NAD(P)(+)] n=1 Tax=Phaffia rhodozyma TaxID=264483 RepID=A0A0F7SRD3_PHARH|nr:Uncharacterized conserved protein [Phaffia rhodozyma]
MSNTVDASRAGIARIKPEFLLTRSSAPVEVPDDDAAENTGKQAGKRTLREDGTETLQSGEEGGERDSKMARGENNTRGGRGGKKKGGQNKNRKFKSMTDDIQICNNIAVDRECSFGESCRRSHNLPLYLASKPADLVFPEMSYVETSSPFLSIPDNATIYCPTFNELGFCPQGYKCRFLKAHITKPALSPTAEKTTETLNAETESLEEKFVGKLVFDEERKTQTEQEGGKWREKNWIRPDLQSQLRSNAYPFPISEAYLSTLEGDHKLPKPKKGKVNISIPAPAQSEEEAMNGNNEETATEQESRIEADKDLVDVPDRPQEKRRLDWTGKTYLAPLTTTGNLPFRRLCVSLGADITCSEMGLATSFLDGGKGEWALTRRHNSEKMFGLQVCGSKPVQLVPTAEVLAKECPDVDFVDVNLGCPIDLVFNKGAGSALFEKPTKLGQILVGMSKALGSIPLTVKMRTGIKDNKNTAHNMIPRFATEWGVSAMTLHGRSRQQRYSKLADWSYIKDCTETLRQSVADANLPPIPIFGNGDCYSAAQYYDSIEQTGVDGVMIARGALTKPWIFTEIKERREWDISSRERLEFIRQASLHAFISTWVLRQILTSHWGSDTTGINTTRRFLCESLSFTHRYIPLGLLEVPARMNDRPPPFQGRDELETLLGSTESKDWVKISEMFLGPCPPDFSFLAKHKSNSYGNAEEGNG